MAVAFNKILIPVDFSLNTEIAVKKAIGLTGAEESVIHLLHVVKPGGKAVAQFRNWTVEKDLEEWKYNIQREHPELKVKVHILPGHSVQGTIIECAHMLNPDLIIIGK